MALDLSRVKERETLPPRREPYWHRIRPGCFLGYRPSIRGGAGTWIGRAYDEEQRRYSFKALGDFAELLGRDQFSVAKNEAERFAAFVEMGGPVAQEPETVGDVCRRYAAVNIEAEGRFKRHVYSDPIARIKASKLRRIHLESWRQRLESRPAVVSRRKGDVQVTRPRAPASVNRDMAMLRAALNKVLVHGAPNTEAAWQEALLPIRNADRQRTLYLDRNQRRILLDVIDMDAEPFARALCLLPLRPGAVAGLTVADFDVRTSELTIGKDKSGKLRRILLPRASAKLFAEQIKERPPKAPLFARPNGRPWDKETWKKPIAAAAAKGKLQPGVTAYTLRHSTITDLVDGGLPLLTVAQISDTSAEMIERHYGHLNRHAALKALAGLALG